MHTKLVCTLIVMLTASLFSSILAQGDGYGLAWQRSLPGLSGTAVISTSDGGYLALGEDASYNSNTNEFYGAHPVIAKTNGDGNVVWSKTVVYEDGGPRTRLSQLVEVKGGYILGGVVDSGQYPGSPLFCLIKISDAGDVVWKTLGMFERSQNYFQAGALTATSDGGCLLVGAFYESTPSIPFIVITKVYSSGQLESSKTLPLDNQIFPWHSGSVSWATQTSDGGFLLLNNQGQSHPISPSTTSLMKIDPSGDVKWMQSYGGGGNYYHTSGACAVVLSNGYLIGGMAAPDGSWSGGMVVRTDLEGNMLWNRTYTSTNLVYSVLNSTQGGFLLLGAGLEPDNSKTSHIWIWQTNDAGEIQTQSDLLTVNPYMLSGLSQLAATGDGGAVFTGSFLYERSQEVSGSTSAADKFWIAKVSVSGHSIALGDSRFPTLEVAMVAGIAVATVLAVLAARQRRLGKKHAMKHEMVTRTTLSHNYQLFRTILPIFLKLVFQH